MKSHSFEDYKKGDLVIVKINNHDKDHWFGENEVIKLGGEFWAGSLERDFGAITLKQQNGNGMFRTFEENYKIRHATLEEIANSQWANLELVNSYEKKVQEISLKKEKLKIQKMLLDQEYLVLELKYKRANLRIEITEAKKVLHDLKRRI